jgi:hypothetical protein
MEPKDLKYAEVRILICELIDGTITPDRMAHLNQILAGDPEAVNHYIDFLSIQVLIKSNMSNMENDFSFPLCSDEMKELTELWRRLAQEERSAPEIHISKEKPQRELIPKVVYPPGEKRKASRFSLVVLAMNAAAILFFFLFVKFAPPKGGIEVATLTDSMNAEWANAGGSPERGARLGTRSGNLLLRGGIAELLFDNNAKFVIEGPAEFELLAEDRIDLHYGRIYAKVPAEAMGFTVSTPNSRIIDLGTEFGLRADALGDVYLHVIKGKTALIAGGKSNKVNLEVREGEAKKVSAATSAISDIPCTTELFIRDTRYLWRGQLDVHFANMIGRDITRVKEALVCKQGAISQKLWTYFRPEGSPVSLGVGEQLIATIEFTPRGNLYDNSFRGFRLGLFNDPTNNQILIDTNKDSGGEGDPWRDAEGYGVQIALSRGPANSAKSFVGKRTDLTDPSLMGSFDAWTFSSGGDNILNRVDTRYTLTLKLDRIAENQMEVTFTIADAGGIISEHTILDDPLGTAEFGAGPIATRFDQLFLRFSTAESTADKLEFHRFQLDYKPNSAVDDRPVESR